MSNNIFFTVLKIEIKYVPGKRVVQMIKRCFVPGSLFQLLKNSIARLFHVSTFTILRRLFLKPEPSAKRCVYTYFCFRD